MPAQPQSYPPARLPQRTDPVHDDADSWEKLLHILEWILIVKVRHSDNMHFSLTHISFGDKSALGERYGAMRAVQMLVDLGHELRRAMRKSDIVARNGTDFWVLIPHVEAQAILPKISKIVEIASDRGLDIVDRDISIYAFQDNSLITEHSLDSPARFLEHMKSNRNVAMSWSVERL